MIVGRAVNRCNRGGYAMRFVARLVTAMFLGSFLLTSAFADDSAKASSNSNPPEAGAPDSGAGTAYLAPAVPMPPQAKASAKASSSSGDSSPAVDLFVGYS